MKKELLNVGKFIVLYVLVGMGLETGKRLVTSIDKNINKLVSNKKHSKVIQPEFKI